MDFFITTDNLKWEINLYFPDKKLAIECDEFSHTKYDKINEIERENYIKNELKCNFIRFNPCDNNFDLSVQLNLILKILF